MRTTASVAVVLTVLAAPAACGKALPADAPPADAGTAVDAATDASGSAADAGADVAPPPPLPECPLVECPSSLPGEDCTDEDCASPIDMPISGSVSVDGAERCVASAGAFVTDTRPRTSSRRVGGLAFHVGTASPGGPKPITLARLGVDGDAAGERFEAVLEGGKLRLCERSGGASTCSPGVPLTNDATVHLHGLVSSETPPRASFALTVACGAPEVLPVTRPFAMGMVRGAVGCIDDGGQGCSITFDDVVIFTAAE